MKAWSLVLILVVAVSVASALTKVKHRKKAFSDPQKKHIADIEEKLEQLLELEAELESEIAEVGEEVEEETSDEENEVVEEDEEEPVEEDEEPVEEDEEPVEEDEEPVDEENLEEEIPEEDIPEEDIPEEEIEDFEEISGNACLDMYCGAGRMCVVNDAREGECRCVNACGEETDVRRRVCSNHNETWMSDCELYRQRCLCQEGDESCLNPDYSHAHIDYYGQCQELPECSEEELDDFPRRMSEWLFNIMREMAERHTLSEHYTRLEREAEQNSTKQWTYAVVWKWCELDTHPKDSAVSRHELFPIRAPLVTLEHCIGTFLDSCDVDDDHLITLKEWGKCSKLSEDELDKLEDMCEDIRDE